MKKNIDVFLKEVTNQIKSKRAKRNVETELEYHLTRTKRQLMEKGFTEEDAEEIAIENMGNPIMIGKELNKLHTPNPILYFKPFLIHLMISIVAVMMSNILEGFDRLMTDNFLRNITYGIVTLITLYLYLFLGYKFLKDHPDKLLLKSISIIFALNICLGLSGYLMMNLGSGIAAENGQLPIIIFIVFNYGFYSIISSLNGLPEFVGILLLGSISPFLLFLGSRKRIKI